MRPAGRLLWAGCDRQQHVTGREVQTVPSQAARQRAHWRSVRRWTAGLLACWMLSSFGMPYFARSLDLSPGGSPFSFWWAAQGSMLVDLTLVVLYAWAMHRLDRRLDLDDEA